MRRSALCRSRRELSNAYLLAKFGLDTAEIEPSKSPMCGRVPEIAEAVRGARRARAPRLGHAGPRTDLVRFMPLLASEHTRWNRDLVREGY